MKKIFDFFWWKDEINRVVIITILMNVVLVFMKMIGGHISDSRALLADGLHSASDIVTSIGVIVGIAMAKKPRDDEHQYGHEKIETMVTFFLAMALIYTGGRIGIDTIFSIFRGDMTMPGKIAPYIALVSVIIKEWQYQMAYRLGKRINSNALIADAWHHRSDALSSIAAFIGIVGARLGFYLLDPLAGLAVALLVMKVGFDIFKDCFHQLIDVSIQLVELDELKEAILEQEKVQHIGDIRTRKHGSKVFVDIRICVDASIDIKEGHLIAEEVESIIRSQLENVKDVIVHLDPCANINEKNKDSCKNF